MDIYRLSPRMWRALRRATGAKYMHQSTAPGCNPLATVPEAEFASGGRRTTSLPTRTLQSLSQQLSAQESVQNIASANELSWPHASSTSCPPIITPWYKMFSGSSNRSFSRTSCSGETFASSGSTRNCWKCGAAVPRVSFLFCEECNILQPSVKGADYFLLLDVPPRFDFDSRWLDTCYKQLLRRLHPDKFSNASEEERQYSEEQSSAVGAAYSVLSNPFARAVYMLEREGAIKAGDDGAGLTLPDDPSLLSSVMEAREEIEDSKDKAALDRIREDNQQQEQSLLQELSKAFGSDDLATAVNLTARLRYVTRIRDAIQEKANRFDDAL